MCQYMVTYIKILWLWYALLIYDDKLWPEYQVLKYYRGPTGMAYSWSLATETYRKPFENKKIPHTLWTHSNLDFFEAGLICLFKAGLILLFEAGFICSFKASLDFICSFKALLDSFVGLNVCWTHLFFQCCFLSFNAGLVCLTWDSFICCSTSLFDAGLVCSFNAAIVFCSILIPLDQHWTHLVNACLSWLTFNSLNAGLVGYWTCFQLEFSMHLLLNQCNLFATCSFGLKSFDTELTWCWTC